MKREWFRMGFWKRMVWFFGIMLFFELSDLLYYIRYGTNFEMSGLISFYMLLIIIVPLFNMKDSV